MKLSIVTFSMLSVIGLTLGFSNFGLAGTDVVLTTGTQTVSAPATTTGVQTAPTEQSVGATKTDTAQNDADRKAEKLKFREDLAAAKLVKVDLAKPVANTTRVKNLGTLLKNAQAVLKTQTNKSVKVFKRFGKRLVLLDVLDVAYAPSGENFGFSVKAESDAVPTQFDPALAKWFSSFLSDTRIFNAFADVYKMNPKDDAGTRNGLAVFQKYRIQPKVKLANFLAADAYVNGKTGQVVAFGVNNPRKGYLVYDFSGVVTSQERL